jgi:hypothetical protein
LFPGGIVKISALKVAARFAAKRPMKPEKLKELMLKLRKGAGFGVKLNLLMPVFEALGGWHFDDAVVLKPEGGKFGGQDEPRSYSNTHPENVKITWENAKANEVSRLPDPEQAKLWETYYMDVSDIETTPSYSKFTYRAWRAVPGIKVTSADGKAFMVDMNLDQFLNEYPSVGGGQARSAFGSPTG